MLINATLGQTTLDEMLQDAIVCHLSHHAGIVKMTNEAYELAWDALYNLIILLAHLSSCCHLFKRVHSGVNRTSVHRLLAPGELIRKFPPLPKIEICDCHKSKSTFMLLSHDRLKMLQSLLVSYI